MRYVCSRYVVKWLALLCLLTGPAHAEVGAMLGARATSLDGDIRDDGEMRFALAAVVMRTLPHGFAIGSEPGYRPSGSTHYRTIDLVLPVVGRYTHAFAPAHHLRVTLALAPAIRIGADQRVSKEEGDVWQALDDVRGWDIDAIAGVGYEHVRRGTRYFGELRFATGLVNIDSGAMPLSIYRREVGVWMGISR